MPRGLGLPVLGQARGGVDVGVDLGVVLLKEGLDLLDAALLQALVLFEEGGVVVLLLLEVGGCWWVTVSRRGFERVRAASRR